MMTTLFTLLTLFSYVGMEVHVFVKLFLHMIFPPRAHVINLQRHTEFV